MTAPLELTGPVPAAQARQLAADYAVRAAAYAIAATLPVDPDAAQHRADLMLAVDQSDGYAAGWLERRARGLA